MLSIYIKKTRFLTCLFGNCLLPLLHPPLFKQTKEEREISEKVIFLQQGSSAFLESQVKNLQDFPKGTVPSELGVIKVSLVFIFLLKCMWFKAKVRYIIFA